MNFKKLAPAAVFSALCASVPAYAASSSTSVETLIETVLSTLQTLSVPVVTIALIWAGYKVLFKGAMLMEVAGPVLGAIVVGAAPWLAELVVG